MNLLKKILNSTSSNNELPQKSHLSLITKVKASLTSVLKAAPSKKIEDAELIELPPSEIKEGCAFVEIGDPVPLYASPLRKASIGEDPVSEFKLINTHQRRFNVFAALHPTKSAAEIEKMMAPAKRPKVTEISRFQSPDEMAIEVMQMAGRVKSNVDKGRRERQSTMIKEAMLMLKCGKTHEEAKQIVTMLSSDEEIPEALMEDLVKIDALFAKNEVTIRRSCSFALEKKLEKDIRKAQPVVANDSRLLDESADELNLSASFLRSIR